ncbi:hypothetical protein CKAH01_00671 [Colletotrichum kahawae]|uniref:Uncharacterized protein n=1 Tax=Colletotrichum kahawae TaxID=34407 RepID=A0AAD9YKB6_COLKA|nr:hypothetical protein CKAH01_00671 [Colletotrichum kahawae]
MPPPIAPTQMWETELGHEHCATQPPRQTNNTAELLPAAAACCALRCPGPKTVLMSDSKWVPCSTVPGNGKMDDEDRMVRATTWGLMDGCTGDDNCYHSFRLQKPTNTRPEVRDAVMMDARASNSEDLIRQPQWTSRMQLLILNLTAILPASKTCGWPFPLAVAVRMQPAPAAASFAQQVEIGE